MLSSTCNYVCEESKQHVHCSPLQAHDACSSSELKRIVSVNQADVLVAAFVKDPHIQGTHYVTLVATAFYTPYSRNIFQKYIPS